MEFTPHIEMGRRKPSYGPLILLLILLAAAFGFWKWYPRTPTALPVVIPAETKPQLVAIVASSTGDVTSLDVSGASSTVRVGDTVKTGETFVTGQKGYVSLEFYSGARAALDKESTLKVDEASLDATYWQKQRVRLHLVTGRVWSRILKLLDADSTYDVSYNNVSSVVRGTAFLITGQDEHFTLDEFDGTVSVTGTQHGSVASGLSVQLSTKIPNQNLTKLTYFTPDQVRNDLWVRQQLRADTDFAKRAADVRRAYGVTEDVSAVGNEAGPYTLDIPPAGMTISTTATFSITTNGKTQVLGSANSEGTELYHSNYLGVNVTTGGVRPFIARKGSLALQTTALFENTTGQGVTTKNVTGEAHWQVLETAMASIDSAGVLHTTPDATGSIHVLARYNDGTHEHSSGITLYVR